MKDENKLFCIADKAEMILGDYGRVYWCPQCGVRAARYPKTRTLQQALDALWTSRGAPTAGSLVPSQGAVEGFDSGGDGMRIVEEIAREILRRKIAVLHSHDYRREPQFVVYIDYDTYRKMSAEFYGSVSCFAEEMMLTQTINGAKYYRVAAENHGWKVFEVPK